MVDVVVGAIVEVVVTGGDGGIGGIRNAVAGTANRGGAGGGTHCLVGAAGGKGIVIVRY